METLRPFLEELRAKDVESPQLYSTFIDMLEQSAKNQKRSLDPTALQVKFLFIALVSCLCLQNMLDVR